jgi:hypothetical protein
MTVSDDLAAPELNPPGSSSSTRTAAFPVLDFESQQKIRLENK